MLYMTHLANKLDDKMYPRWRAQTQSIFSEIQSGLNKIQCDPPLPEITSIKEHLPINENLPRKEYIKAVQSIHEKIVTLATKKYFYNPHINAFFYNAYLSLNTQMSFSATKLPSYTEALLNPSGKKTKKSKSSAYKKIYEKLESKAVINVVENDILSAFQDKFFLLQSSVQAIPESLGPVKGDDISNSVFREMEDSIGPLPTELETFSPFLNKKIYAFAFDSYYHHVASLYEIKYKVEKLTADKPNGSTKEKYKQLQLSSLGNKKTITYLDNIAIKLGFKNAADLYRNHCNIFDQEASNAFKDNKNRFINFANQDDTYKEDDPLEQIKSSASEEYSRISQSKSKDDLMYFSILMYYGNDSISNIEGIQRISNITFKLAVNDFLPSFFYPTINYLLKLASASDITKNLSGEILVMKLLGLGKLHTEDTLLKVRWDATYSDLKEEFNLLNQEKEKEKEKEEEIHFSTLSSQIKNKRTGEIIEKLAEIQFLIKEKEEEILRKNNEIENSNPKSKSKLEGDRRILTNEHEEQQQKYLILKKMFDDQAKERLFEIDYERLDDLKDVLEENIIKLNQESSEKENPNEKQRFLNSKKETICIEQLESVVEQQTLFANLQQTQPLKLIEKIRTLCKEYTSKQDIYLENELKIALNVFTRKKEFDLSLDLPEDKMIDFLKYIKTEKDNLLVKLLEKDHPILIAFDFLILRLETTLEYKKTEKEEEAPSVSKAITNFFHCHNQEESLHKKKQEKDKKINPPKRGG